MSSPDGSFLQVTNNQTKNNGGEGGGAPSSPRAKGTAAVALHVKFSKCRSAPIMRRFPLSSLICIQICRAEERGDLQRSSFEQRAHLPRVAPPKCVWVQSQAFPFELARIGQRSREVQRSAAVASENLLVLATQPNERISRSYFNILQFCRLRNKLFVVHLEIKDAQF